MSQELELHGTLQLRSATLEDTEGLQTYCFPDQSVQEVTDHLTKDLEESSEDDVYRIVAETGGHPIGQIRIERSVLENTTATIGDLKVLAPFRAFGVSTMLVEYAEKLAKDNGVQSLERTTPFQYWVLLLISQFSSFVLSPQFLTASFVITPRHSYL